MNITDSLVHIVESGVEAQPTERERLETLCMLAREMFFNTETAYDTVSGKMVLVR